MISQEKFLASIKEEIRITQHLFSKLGPEHLDYRPAEGMRSIRELLRYLTFCSIGPAHAIVHGDWATVAPRREAVDALPMDDFPDRMARQYEEIRELLAGLGPDDFERQLEMPWGTADTMSAHLLNTSLKFLTAYRMQLFLYAKMAGLSELSTHDCWIGVDPPAGS